MSVKKSKSGFHKLERTRLAILLPAAFWLSFSGFGLAQKSTTSAPKSSMEEPQEAPPPGDWAVDLLDAILSSPNSEAHDALHRASFSAGRALVPQLEAALKDDRTAEFAAQSLAFIGGEKTMEILGKLVSDLRDLNLRRFYYGALGEFDSPEATQTLLEVVKRSDSEPDRTVTEAAILAFTVRSDMSLLPKLQEIQARLHDVVIRDDVDNALAVIERRAKYLTSPAGKAAGSSIERAVRTYFIPALEPPGPPSPPARSRAAGPAPGKPPVQVTIQSLTFSPDKTRALARVIFEDPTARADYDIVLQKRYGDWSVASVWLGAEVEKVPQAPERPPAQPP